MKPRRMRWVVHEREMHMILVGKEMALENVDWICLIQDKDQWWAFKSAVMNLQVHKILEMS
jgi:hypothetical protein